MRAKLQTEDEQFKPVTIEITFETEKEMRDFQAFFNYTPVCDIFYRLELNPDIIRDAIPCGPHKNWAAFVNRAKGIKS